MLKLFYNDLENIYTCLLNDYLKQGYIINTKTFSGHQGEICKIDLRHELKPNNVIRILFDREHNNKTYDDIYKIFVLKYYNVDKMGTLWDNKFDEILQQNLYYEYGKNSKENKIYLTSVDDYEELEKIRDTRDTLKGKYKSIQIDINSKIGNYIFKYCKNKNGYKSIKKDDISWIRKDKSGYTVFFKGGKSNIFLRYSK